MSKHELEIPDELLVDLFIKYREYRKAMAENIDGSLKYQKYTFPNGQTVDFAKEMTFDELAVFAIRAFINPLPELKPKNQRQNND